MKRKRQSNLRLTSNSDMRKKYFVAGVVKRGTSESWTIFRRSTWRVVKVLTFLAFIGGVGYGATVGWKKLFWQNPDYSLQDITFTTDGTLTRDQARTTANVKLGGNIYSYKVSAIREAIRTLPQVESVEVTRYLPNRIEVTVKERKPTAWLTAAPLEKKPGAAPTHLLDASGIVFQPRRVPHEFKSLPVISGVQTEDLEPGKPIRKAEVLAALDLLSRTRENSPVKVTSVDVSKGCFIVATDQRRAQLTFGLDDIAGQLDRLSAVRNEALLIGQEIQTINLIPIRNIPVTFIQPTAAENEDAPEPAPSPKMIPAKMKTGADATSSNKDKAKPARKREEPPKPKESPKGDGGGLLKHFRTA